MDTNDGSTASKADMWPLSESDYLAARQAMLRHSILRRAAHVASTSGKITLFIGISAVCLSLVWWSWSGIIAGAGVCAIGLIERRGDRRIKSAQPAAAKLLAINQVAFFALIAAYCVVQMVAFSPQKAKDEALSPEVRSDLAALPDLQRSIDSAIDTWGSVVVYGFYSLVILASIGFQGGMAIYYLTRRKHIEAWNRETPPWIRRLFVELGV